MKEDKPAVMSQNGIGYGEEASLYAIFCILGVSGIVTGKHSRLKIVETLFIIYDFVWHADVKSQAGKPGLNSVWTSKKLNTDSKYGSTPEYSRPKNNATIFSAPNFLTIKTQLIDFYGFKEAGSIDETNWVSR